MTQELPHFAPGWKARAIQVEGLDLRLEYLEKGLACECDAVTRGFMRLNMAFTLHAQGAKDAASQMLAEIALDPLTSPDVELLAKHAVERFLGTNDQSDDQAPEAGQADRSLSVEALARLMQEASQGDMLSQDKLATLYRTGEGVVQSYLEAHAWYLRAASFSYPQLGRFPALHGP